MNNDTFKFEENEKEYQIIKIINPKNVFYDYIIYTNDGVNLFASRYKVNNGQIELSPIEEEYEWNYLDEYLKEVKNA